MAINKTFGVGIDSDKSTVNNKKLIQYINLKLAALGYPYYKDERTSLFLDVAAPLLNNYKEKSRVLSNHLTPIGQRIQDFIDDYLKDVPESNGVSLPQHTLALDKHGLSRMMSLPPNADKYETDIVYSYRTAQGVVHNPKHDKRTTKGVFHIAEGGLPISNDKKAVPKAVFANLLKEAFNPPKELMQLPYTATMEDKAELFVSLFLRPIVVPEVKGISPEKAMEIRFFAPGNLICNLDFVESIFGNAGDPELPENDSALQPESWTGHTGCVILATHLINLTKKELGLPHYDDATERQRRDGMCWKNEDEKYNDGNAFKITARDERGVVITIIADNYFGYCKKEVKTMLSYSANLYGLAEEEHAGGALAFPAYDLGEHFANDSISFSPDHTFKEMLQLYSYQMDLQPEGYGIDKIYKNIIYVPENTSFNLLKQTVSWTKHKETTSIKLLPQNYYILPSGYRVQMRKRLNGKMWHLTGAVGEGTFCHKPCTVSGGGKSEISKSILDAMIQGSVIVSDLKEDLDYIKNIIDNDFSYRFKIKPDYSERPPRKILDESRSLGSVIKLLTPDPEYTDEYNNWLKELPQRVKDLIYIIKRRYHKGESKHWRESFSVDKVNGLPGNELKYDGRKLIANYLRVGHDLDGSWRIFQVRQDFYAAQKVQMEDDISASAIIPASQLEYLNSEYKNESVKIVANCEARLFQRPDDCVHKGYDKQAEKDLSSPYAFLSNFEPLTRAQVQEIKEDTIGFDLYTEPVKELIDKFLESEKPEYLAIPSEPRLVEGKPSANPRYLQIRPDFERPIDKYLAETCTRIRRKIPLNKPLHLPVNAVLPGRRNNPEDAKNNVPPLAVYNPIHYQELPELFIDFICSITGKSPSTTGFGSEGALTKGPFNNLLTSADLNNTLLSFVITGYQTLSSAAGYVGPKYKVDHDVSLLMPEVISRMSVKERNPEYLIEKKYLEKVENFTHDGEEIDASMLGYRITNKFVRHFIGRIFSNPDAVFTEEMLHPELQDKDTFVKSLKNLIITQKRVAEGFMKDGTFETLCPPLQALVKTMIDGEYEGMDRNNPEFRKMFTREYIMESDWYKNRLKLKQEKDIAYWENSIKYIQNVISMENYKEAVERLELIDKLDEAKAKLKKVKSKAYLESLVGTIGVDPLKA